MKKHLTPVIVSVAFFSVATLISSAIPDSALAAYLWQWQVNGQTLSAGQSTSDGTATWTRTSTTDGGTLTLDNYHGGQLKVSANGTTSSTPDDFTIELLGDNTVTVDKGIGIMALGNVKFTGTGTLTITAGLPISGNDYIISTIDSSGTSLEGNYRFPSNTTIVIAPSTVEVSTPPATPPAAPSTITSEETVASDAVSSNTSESSIPEGGAPTSNSTTSAPTKCDNIWQIIGISALIGCGILLIVVIALAAALAKKKSHTSATPTTPSPTTPTISAPTASQPIDE